VQWRSECLPVGVSCISKDKGRARLQAHMLHRNYGFVCVKNFISLSFFAGLPLNFNLLYKCTCGKLRSTRHFELLLALDREQLIYIHTCIYMYIYIYKTIYNC
jgi:hypothetical protein